MTDGKESVYQGQSSGLGEVCNLGERQESPDDVVVIDGAAELLTELRRQGNNLNQLMILARQRRIELVNFQPFMEVYQDTWRALNLLLSRGA